MSIDINSVLNIYVIRHVVTQHLKGEDLKQCLAVNREWRDIFTPIVWQRLYLRLPYILERESVAAELQAIVQRIGGHVRHLALNTVDSLGMTAPYLTNITHIEVDKHQLVLADDVGDSPEGVEHQGSPSSSLPWLRLIAFLKSCPRLHVLKLTLSDKSYFDHFISALSSSLQQLRELDLTIDHVLDTSDVVVLLMNLPKLTSLRIMGNETWSIDHDTTLLRTRWFPDLLTLGLQNNIYSPLSVFNFNATLSFWRQCPSLEEYDLEWMNQKEFSKFSQLFDFRDKHGEPVRRVRTLKFPASETFVLNDEDVARIFMGCVPQHVRHIRLSRNCRLGPKTFDILLSTQAESLEALDLDRVVIEGIRPSPLMQRVLSSCPRLKELSTYCGRLDLQRVPHLHVDDIVSGPAWVCKDLRMLHMTIIGACYSDENNHTGNKTIDLVMRQLGSMTGLTEIGSAQHFGAHLRPFLFDLSPPGNVEQPLPLLKDVLPFSLGAGGLQYLAHLKLDYINVARYMHRIGFEEVKWMAEHWPNLGFAYGLGLPDNKEAQEVVEWVQKTFQLTHTVN